MRHTVAQPSDAQLAPLLAGYREALAARRQVMMVSAAVLLAAMALAWWGAKVDPAKFWAGLPNFGSYFARLAHLDTGGIGLRLYEQIRVIEWQQPAHSIVTVLITVAIIDAVSQRLRTALIGRLAR